MKINLVSHARRWATRGAFTLVALFVLLALLAPHITPSAFAAPKATRNVSPSGTDSGDCSVGACKTITYALTQTVAGDTINVAAGTYSAANGETLPLVPTVNVTINGASASSTFIDGGSTTRVMTVNSGRNVTLQNVTIQNGRGLMGGNCGALFTCGGGVFLDGGTLTLSNSTFSGNSANYGGGINIYYGTLTVSNSTFSGNSATTNDGGGIRNRGGTLTVSNSTFSGNSANNGGGINNNGTLNVTNSTLSGNTATSQGGGIYHLPGTFNFANTIIANSPSGGDVYVETFLCFPFCPMGTSTNNLVMDGSGGATFSGDPKLGALANNGGTTQTFALQSNSPAIDKGSATTCSNSPISGLDQRGQPRNDLQCDIGAYEMQTSDRNNTTLTPSTSAMTTYGPPRVGIQDVGATGQVITATKLTNWSGGTPANTLGAWWELSAPTTTGLNLNLKLCYSAAETGNLNETGAHFWRYSGGTWNDAGAVASFIGASPNRCAQISGVTALSRWTLSNNGGPGNAPTAVTLSSFNAQPGFDLVAWFKQFLGLGK